MGYADVVLADRPVAYWRMDSTRDLTGHGHPLAFGNGPTQTFLNAVAGDPLRGKSFVNSSSQYASVALDLSAYTAVAIEAWVWWATQGTNTDPMLWAFGAAGDRFFFTPGSSAPNAGKMQVTINVGANNNYSEYNLFESGPRRDLRHVVALYKRNIGAAQGVDIFVDGVRPTRTGGAAQSCAGAFPNSTLFLASYIGGALYGSCALQDVAVYGGTANTILDLLPPNRILAHYRAGTLERRALRRR